VHLLNLFINVKIMMKKWKILQMMIVAKMTLVGEPRERREQ
jgi:hypothetical protein